MKDSSTQTINHLPEQAFYLDNWLVCPTEHTLRHRQRAVTRQLESKAMLVLQQLARHSGEFVTREQLLESVWNTRFVSEDVLTGAVAAIRKALGDNTKRPRYIETRRGLGYRLLITPVPQADQSVTRPPRGYRTIAALLLIVTAGLLLIKPPSSVTQPGPPTLAVLPFADYSATTEQGYFADAMTEALIQKLAELQTFRVISRTSVMRYRNSRKNARQIAAELGADWFVEGSVLHAQDRVRITAQLIDAQRDEHLWAGHFERAYSDVFALLNDAATAISMPVMNTAVNNQSPPTVQASDYALPADDLDNYLLARYLLSSQTPQNMTRALQQFTQLSMQQADFYGGHLGRAQALLALFKQAQLDNNVLDEALLAAQRALDLNPQSGPAYRCRGQIVFFRDLDYQQAESDYLMSIALNASDHIARRRYAWLLVAQQRYPEAGAQLAELKRLDPVYYADAANGLLLLYAQRTDEAIDELERLRATSPDSPDIHTVLWRAYLAAGQHHLASQTLLEWLRLRGLAGSQYTDLQTRLQNTDSQGFYLAVLSHKLLASPLQQAILELQLGHTETALALIEQAWQAHHPAIAYLAVMPNLRDLHDQPRFQNLLSQISHSSQLRSLSALP